MSDTNKRDFVIALGGSIVCPNEVNIPYLKEFYTFLLGQIKLGQRFILVVGGGGPARQYQKAASEIVTVSDEDKDWIGVHATRLNAHLLRTIFREEANPIIFEARGKISEFGDYSVVIGAGWRPGWSTDFVATQIAVDLGVAQAIILGKPEYVYDKDNCLHADAKAIENITWQEYMKLIPSEWVPGIHAPVDPVAARLGQESGLEVIVAGGKDLANVKNILDGQSFRGTTIKG